MENVENAIGEGAEVNEAVEVKRGKGVPRTAEQKEKQKESMQKRWADPAYRQAVADGRAKAKAAKLAAAAEATPVTETETANVEG